MAEKASQASDPWSGTVGSAQRWGQDDCRGLIRRKLIRRCRLRSTFAGAGEDRQYSQHYRYEDFHTAIIRAIQGLSIVRKPHILRLSRESMSRTRYGAEVQYAQVWILACVSTPHSQHFYIEFFKTLDGGRYGITPISRHGGCSAPLRTILAPVRDGGSLS